MPSRPLLTLPPPKRIIPPSAGGGGNKKTGPSLDEQRQRIPSQFAELKRALEEQKLLLGSNPLGIEPGQVLVLETLCSIADFCRVIKSIRGLEWLIDEPFADSIDDDDLDDSEPDAPTPVDRIPEQLGFFHPPQSEPEQEETAKGHLYLAFTNQQALGELERLWRLYESAPDEKFPNGLGPLREAFRYVKNIRAWGVQDRLRETGLESDWAERRAAGDEVVPVEIELWYRNAPEERARRARHITHQVHAEGGTVKSVYELPEIRYHALLAHLPISSVQKLVDHDYTQLIKSDDVMFFRPVGQIVGSPLVSGLDTERLAEGHIPPLPNQQHRLRVALLDGLPLANHALLAGRLVIDDPDDWGADYQASEQQHGTAMASLILHGELDSPSEPLSCSLYVRPILKPERSSFGGSQERMPTDGLVVDLMYRALRRMFEGEGTGDAKTAPVAPDVVVINLSVGDSHRPFLGRTISPWARLLDWAAWRYKVLFCVSAGNYGQLTVRLSAATFVALPRSEQERNVLISLTEDRRHRRILSPSEAMNVLTVGAAHADRSERRGSDRRLDAIVTSHTVSPISAQGPGFRQSVKPELLFPGGRVVFNTSHLVSQTEVKLSAPIAESSGPPGLRVAVPGVSPGESDRTAHSRGTSLSTALASRAAAQCLSVLEDLHTTWDGDGIGRAHLPVLLKAMLVHCSEWNEAARKVVRSVIESRSALSSQKERALMARLYGYGVADPCRVIECTSNRATLLGYGSLSAKDVYEYRIPLPPSIAGQRIYRRVIVTLAWLTPINPEHRHHRVAKLRFQMRKPDGSSQDALKRQDVEYHEARNGTVQHELFAGKQFADDEWLVLHIQCSEDAGTLSDPIPFGLVVTVEAPDSELPIYEEVRARVSVPVAIPVSVGS